MPWCVVVRAEEAVDEPLGDSLVAAAAQVDEIACREAPTRPGPDGAVAPHQRTLVDEGGSRRSCGRPKGPNHGRLVDGEEPGDPGRSTLTVEGTRHEDSRLRCVLAQGAEKVGGGGLELLGQEIRPPHVVRPERDDDEGRVEPFEQDASQLAIGSAQPADLGAVDSDGVDEDPGSAAPEVGAQNPNLSATGVADGEGARQLDGGLRADERHDRTAPQDRPVDSGTRRGRSVDGLADVPAKGGDPVDRNGKAPIPGGRERHHLGFGECRLQARAPLSTRGERDTPEPDEGIHGVAPESDRLEPAVPAASRPVVAEVAPGIPGHDEPRAPVAEPGLEKVPRVPRQEVGCDVRIAQPEDTDLLLLTPFERLETVEEGGEGGGALEDRRAVLEPHP